MTLYGTGFDPVSGNNIVRFGNVVATVTAVNVNSGTLTVTVPDFATTGPLTIQVGAIRSLVAGNVTISLVGKNMYTVAGNLPPPPGTQAIQWRISGSIDHFGLGCDAGGNFYFTDDYRIYKVTGAGIISAIAGQSVRGFSGDGGPATSALLSRPTGLVFDASGNLFFADSGNGRIRKITTGGIITTVAGGGDRVYNGNQPYLVGDGGPATTANLSNPQDIAFDSGGNLYISDNGNARIRRVTPAGIISTVAGNGTQNFSGDGGPATSASLSGPGGIVVDTIGNIFFVDTNNYRVRKITRSGIISTFLGDILPSSGLFGPQDMTLDSSGNFIISDAIAYRIWKVTPAGQVSVVAGCWRPGFSGDGGPATSASIAWPLGVAVDVNRNVIFADSGNKRVRKVTPAGIISTVAGTDKYGPVGDGGPALAASIGLPRSVARDASGNLYIADEDNDRIRKVTSDGTITTFAGGGKGSGSFFGDGGPATAAYIYRPKGMAFDGIGNLFVADNVNHRIRKITTSGIISTVAGNGNMGFSGDGGSATLASLAYPSDVVPDAAGNLFIADTHNYRIRKVTPDGIITTYAGMGYGGSMADNVPASSAFVYSPVGLALDPSGNLFYSDDRFHRVRKITPAGIISTVAGNGTAGFSGDGDVATLASLNSPMGIAVDASGNLFIADRYNHRIRKVTSAGFIFTVAGTGSPGYTGDGGGAMSASLNQPWDVALDASGNLFIADAGNNLIRSVR